MSINLSQISQNKISFSKRQTQTKKASKRSKNSKKTNNQNKYTTKELKNKRTSKSKKDQITKYKVQGPISRRRVLYINADTPLFNCIHSASKAVKSPYILSMTGSKQKKHKHIFIRNICEYLFAKCEYLLFV